MSVRHRARAAIADYLVYSKFIVDTRDVNKFQHTSINAFDLLADILLFRVSHVQNYRYVLRGFIKNCGRFAPPPSCEASLEMAAFGRETGKLLV